MDYVTLETDEFVYGVGDEILPGVSRVIAENPSKFTYRGTGTYIIGGGQDVAVIDPGPILPSHREALAGALTGRTVRAILVTHCHADHSPLAAWLRDETGAPTYAYGPHGAATVEWDIGALPDDFGRPEPTDVADDEPTGPDEPKLEESTDTAFVPDVEVRSGDVVFTDTAISVAALHTPGHTSNHSCFAMTSSAGGRILFTGDHVMGWSTTVVAPPDGDMGAYMNSLRMVAGRRDDVAVPTHGSPIERPGRFVGDLVDHRLERERQVLDAVRRGLDTIPDIVEDLYVDVRVELHRPAGSSVLGHLVKLVSDGIVVVDGSSAADSASDASPASVPRLDSNYLPV
ncbi:MBL fold metallo-hydrolase [Ilumatobacter sp.]|uniref:MBL fold metallo-hydrolase n=1 Tax=Ilumatobacter sp. TaxID=1967498 RepID=UPI003C64DDAA